LSRQRIVGVLLAAGAGVRFGAGGKLLHPLPDGTPIAVASARNLIAALPRSIAVIRPQQEGLQAQLEALGFTVTICPKADEGMGVSLAHAISASSAASNDEIGGWVVALADMPFIRPATIMAVADEIANGAMLAAPFHRGERGHPVGFSARLRDELASLASDEGARNVVKRHAADLARVDCDDPGIVADIDTPADLSLRADVQAGTKRAR